MTATMDQQFQEAIQRLPSECTAAYLEALTSVPELVLRESDPQDFLRVENGNVERASIRLAKYWKERKRVFMDRAFLPLDLSGNGALTPDEVEHFKCGFLRLLPADSAGRPVIFSDPKRVPVGAGGSEGGVRPRMRFHFFSTLASQCAPSAQDVGIVTVRLMQVHAKFTNPSGAYLEDVLLGCMPLKFFSIQMCIEYNGSAAHAVKTAVPAILQRMGKNLSGITHVHVATEPSDFLTQLEKHGLEKSNLPSSVGGTRTFDVFDAKKKFKSQEHPEGTNISPSVGGTKTCDAFDAKKQFGSEEHVEGVPQAVSPNEAPSPLSTLPALFQFVLGVLMMLEDQKKKKLSALLLERNTQEILKVLLKPWASQQNAVVAVSSSKKRKLETEDQVSPSPERAALLQRIQAVREENAVLAANITKKLEGTTPALSTKSDASFTFMPSKVQFAFGVLASLEQKRGCFLRDLLVDPKIQMILGGLLGSFGLGKGTVKS